MCSAHSVVALRLCLKPALRYVAHPPPWPASPGTSAVVAGRGASTERVEADSPSQAPTLERGVRAHRLEKP